MNEDVLNIIEDLNEMRLLKQRELEWLNRRITYLENVMYDRCEHVWVNLKCNKCYLFKR